jgi:hypothetical protein
VHHPCITRAPIEDVDDATDEGEVVFLSQSHSSPGAGRRIRLIGLLRENLHLQGFPIDGAIAVHHPCITQFLTRAATRDLA